MWQYYLNMELQDDYVVNDVCNAVALRSDIHGASMIGSEMVIHRGDHSFRPGKYFVVAESTQLSYTKTCVGI